MMFVCPMCRRPAASTVQHFFDGCPVPPHPYCRNHTTEKEPVMAHCATCGQRLPPPPKPAPATDIMERVSQVRDKSPHLGERQGRVWND